MEKNYYIKSMKTKRRGRPPKDKAARKDVDLRIPVTAEQKQLVMKAVELDQIDMASWARPILLEAAKRRVEMDTASK
jgi:hypothetical protein